MGGLAYECGARDARLSTRPATTPRRTSRSCGRDPGAGAASLRVVRLYDPDGGVQLIDFAAEVRDQARALRDLDAPRGAVVVGGSRLWMPLSRLLSAHGRP